MPSLNIRHPILCLVTDPRVAPECLPEIVGRAVDGGVNLVQLRLPGLPAGRMYNIGEAVLRAIDGHAPLVVNDRADVARALGAAGVQLGEESLPVTAARTVVGPDALIGRSVHSVEGAIGAEAAGASYLILGTIFPTGSHPDAPGAGLDLVRRVCDSIRRPVIAIGGMTAANAAAVRAAGATGVAVLSAILEAPDPARAAADIWSALNEAAE